MLTQNAVDYSDRCPLIADTNGHVYNYVNRQQNTTTEVSSLKAAEIKKTFDQKFSIFIALLLHVYELYQ